MVAVFVGFALGDLAEFNQMGLGLAVAVILDATVVRTILVPVDHGAPGRGELVPAAGGCGSCRTSTSSGRSTRGSSRARRLRSASRCRSREAGGQVVNLSRHLGSVNLS